MGRITCSCVVCLWYTGIFVSSNVPSEAVDRRATGVAYGSSSSVPSERRPVEKVAFYGRNLTSAFFFSQVFESLGVKPLKIDLLKSFFASRDLTTRDNLKLALPS